MKLKSLLFILLFIQSVTQAQYISKILEYTPAPGQFINRTGGFPSSKESIIGSVTGLLSLGSFGGYVVFSFENPIKNDPENPFGVDFTIFGNPSVDWSEPGIVWVMKDENNNGLADDTWYELAGSDYFFSTTIKNYETTYTNPKQTVAANVNWEDNLGNSGVVLKNTFNTQQYYPITDSFPNIDYDEFTYSGTKISVEIDETVPTNVKSYKKAFGYVDNQLRGLAPYTLPDNPYTLEKENSGGDAFDISWAVNENGEYVDLKEIDFVKVQNSALANAGWTGEISTEITGAIDVIPNSTISGVTDMIVIKRIPNILKGNKYQLEVAAFINGRYNENAEILWTTNLPEANINDNNILTFSTSGDLTISATLASNSAISATQTIKLIHAPYGVSSQEIKQEDLHVFPNPASEYLYVSGAKNAKIQICNMFGAILIEKNSCEEQKISVNHLPSGIYMIRIITDETTKTSTFIKK